MCLLQSHTISIHTFCGQNEYKSCDETKQLVFQFSPTLSLSLCKQIANNSMTQKSKHANNITHCKLLAHIQNICIGNEATFPLATTVKAFVRESENFNFAHSQVCFCSPAVTRICTLAVYLAKSRSQRRTQCSSNMFFTFNTQNILQLSARAHTTHMQQKHGHAKVSTRIILFRIQQSTKNQHRVPSPSPFSSFWKTVFFPR